MRRSVGQILFLVFLLSACASDSAPQIRMTVYKSPACGCCDDWIGYVEQNGFKVTTEYVQDMSQIKSRFRVPPELQSCHTALVEGYVIEGHVPVEEINRLLLERPEVIGLAVAGMPIGSPGMEVDGIEPQSFEVIAFDKTGKMEVFARYPNK